MGKTLRTRPSVDNDTDTKRAFRLLSTVVEYSISIWIWITAVIGGSAVGLSLCTRRYVRTAGVR